MSEFTVKLIDGAAKMREMFLSLPSLVTNLQNQESCNSKKALQIVFSVLNFCTLLERFLVSVPN